MQPRSRNVVIVAEAPETLTMVCGISLLERLLRTLQRLGVRDVAIRSATSDHILEHLSRPSWARAEITVTLEARESRAFTARDIAGPSLVLSTGYYDHRLLAPLLEVARTTFLIDSAPPAALHPLLLRETRESIGYLCRAAFVGAQWLDGAAADEPLWDQLTAAAEQNRISVLDAAAVSPYVAGMRRSIRPVWLPAPAHQHLRAAEHLLLDAAQNGTLDLPAIVHGPIETAIIARLCRTSITPNQITVFNGFVSVAVAVLFASGHLAAGTVLALIVGVLDGLDGKQARVKVETTPLGQYEHLLDYALELSWWAALAYHFTVSRQLPAAALLLALLVTTDLIDRAVKRRIKHLTGRNMDDVAPFERFVRLIGGRRNIYVWIFAAGLVLGIPYQGFGGLCWWGAVTASVHLVRAGFIAKRCRQA
ncbi:hypothetical protein BH18VER1_BH18VER1_12380 [soil metagenome]